MASRIEDLRRRAEGVRTGPLQPYQEAMGGTILPGPAAGQSLLRLMATPFMEEAAQRGIGGLQDFITEDESFQQFQKSNPDFAQGLLKLLNLAPALVMAGGITARGASRPHSDIVSRSPGAEQFGRMAKQAKDKSSVGSLIDDLINLRKAPQMDELPKVRELDPKRSEDALEILLRR